MDNEAVGQDTTGLMRRPTASLPGESAAGVVGGVPWLHDGPASARWGCAQGLVSLGFPVGGWKKDEAGPEVVAIAAHHTRGRGFGADCWRATPRTPFQDDMDLAILEMDADCAGVADGEGLQLNALRTISEHDMAGALPCEGRVLGKSFWRRPAVDRGRRGVSRDAEG
jgi:hypothetical protein